LYVDSPQFQRALNLRLTAEIQAFKQHHRDLSCALADVNLKIGETNRELRAIKAEKQARPTNNNGSRQPAPPKKMPFLDDPEFPSYVMLACRDVLSDGLYADVIRTAKALMFDARKMGLPD